MTLRSDRALPPSRSPALRLGFLLVGVVLAATLAPTPLEAQVLDPAPRIPAPAATPHAAPPRDPVEYYFAQALEVPPDADLHTTANTWFLVIQSAVSADLQRRSTAGDEVVDRGALVQSVAGEVMDRLRDLRPDSPVPDLVLAYVTSPPAARRDAAVALLDAYPDDPRVVTLAHEVLLDAQQRPRAVEIAEAFVARHPTESTGYRLLLRSGNHTGEERAEIIRRWAEAVPPSPEMLDHWLMKDIERDPEITARLVEATLEAELGGEAGLRSCRRIQSLREERYTTAARECFARIADDPESTPGTARGARDELHRAILAEDPSRLPEILATRSPRERLEPLIATGRRLAEDGRCDEAMPLFTEAADLAAEHGARLAVGMTLHHCAERPDARALYLELLPEVPANEVETYVRSWTVRHSDPLRGDVPWEAAEILEARAAAQPDEEAFRLALDVVYEVHAADGATRREAGTGN